MLEWFMFLEVGQKPLLHHHWGQNMQQKEPQRESDATKTLETVSV